MPDSYVSSRVDSFSPSNPFPNGSSPAIQQNTPGLSPVIRKKLMGYVGFANLPNQVHRKSVRKGFQFTAMVVGPFSLPLPLPLLTLPQANPASESPRSLTPSSTRLFTLPSSLFLPPTSVPRRSPSRALEQVCPVPVLLRLVLNPHALRYRGEWCPSASNGRRHPWVWRLC